MLARSTFCCVLFVLVVAACGDEPVPLGGHIYLHWSEDGYLADFAAYFVPTSWGREPSGCQVRRSADGDCALERCSQPGSGALEDRKENAGRIDVSGPYERLTLVPALGGSSSLYQLDDEATVNSTSETVAAEGAAIPAFAFSSVQVPTAIAVPTELYPKTPDSTHDLPVTWQRGGDGSVVFAIDSATRDQTLHLSCTWDPAAHSGIVPAELVPDCANNACSWSIGARVTHQVMAGDVRVELIIDHGGVASGSFGDPMTSY